MGGLTHEQQSLTGNPSRHAIGDSYDDHSLDQSQSYEPDLTGGPQAGLNSDE